MTIGTINVRVILDRKSQKYHSPHDAVTGVVQLEFNPFSRKEGPTGAEEVFGPLQVKIVFGGYLELRIEEAREALPTRVIQDRPLFQETQLIYDGPFRASPSEKKEFPFTAFFAERAHRSAPWRGDALVHPFDRVREPTNPGPGRERQPQTEGDLLPPSCELTATTGSMNAIAKVEYYPKAEVIMPGIDVEIETKGLKPIVLYHPAPPGPGSLQGSTVFEQSHTVASKDLIPEGERPHGFRGKAKALFKESEPPQYAFEVVCTSVPEHVYPGQQLSFEVGVRSNSERTTTTVQPEIKLDECKVTIVGLSSLFTDNVEPVEDRKDEATVNGTVQPPGLFSKEHDFSKRITTEPLPLKIEMIMHCGTSKVHARRELPVKVHPPLSAAGTVSGPPGVYGGGQERLPAYKESWS
ncbi:hypothetical protein LTR37_012035 [Vermiconidia calcicola]|uniref:Uncharacterized protein n=1 Tax=Vermiconidia calcicola TaxID=1690605 RepID=A0ACC3N1S5_9PEZI|nr:hypothetical protein LTR37_012035 [Vermiconidia calcicola]